MNISTIRSFLVHELKVVNKISSYSFFFITFLLAFFTIVPKGLKFFKSESVLNKDVLRMFHALPASEFAALFILVIINRDFKNQRISRLVLNGFSVDLILVRLGLRVLLFSIILSSFYYILTNGFINIIYEKSYLYQFGIEILLTYLFCIVYCVGILLLIYSFSNSLLITIGLYFLFSTIESAAVLKFSEITGYFPFLAVKKFATDGSSLFIWLYFLFFYVGFYLRFKFRRSY